MKKFRTELAKLLAIFVIALVSLSPAAYAGFLPEFNDPVHFADDVDNSEDDADDSGNFDFSAFSSVEETSNPSFSALSINAPGEGQAYAIPKPQTPAPNYLKYDESFSTNLFSGAASYTYQIEVPLGILGLQPSLSLSYNHHAARALPTVAGTGWNLNLNYIYRDTNNTRSDTSDDAFILNLNGLHEKLVYVPSEKRYHTQHENYLFIEQLHSDKNEKGSYWIVKSKDGTKYRFGYRKDSELVSNLENYISVWSLDEVKDVNGNNITYNYVENPNSDKGVVYIDNVSYGLSSIKFVYNHAAYTSPDFYIDGREVRQSGIVEEVVVKHSTSLVRKYLLKYQMMEDKPFLKSITEVGSDGTSELPPVTFEYNRFESGFQESPTWQLPEDSYFGTDKDEGLRLLDLNGDGLVDIVKAKGSSSQVRYNTGNGFAPSQSLPNFIATGFVDGEGNDMGVRLIDYDGNAKIDFVQSISGAVKSKILKTNTGAALNDASYTLPSEISFVEKIRETSCNPPYLEGYDCNKEISCDGNTCKRTCSRTTCSDSGNEVLNYVGDPSWNEDDYDEEDTGQKFYPKPDKCYKFEYTGSPDKDDDDSECYDLYTDDDFEDDDYDEDCNGKDVDAYAGIGFVGNRNSGSWLSTVPGTDDYGFVGNVENGYWSNRYVSRYGRDIYPDDSGSNKGDWDGFNNEICDEAGTYTVYCVPTYTACANWNKQLCGYGCAGEGTTSFVVMGIYASYNNNLWDALDDNRPECDEMVDDNDYYGDGTYKVTEYAATTTYQYPECTIPFYVKDKGIRIADVNSDGRTDLIQGVDGTRRTWLNNGKGFSLTEEWTPPSEAYFTDSEGKDKGVRLGDVNGDGLIDVVKGEGTSRKTWLNTGKGWEYKSELAMPAESVFVNNGENQGVQLTDVNVDGLDDLVKAKDSQINVWINTGNGWAEKAWNFPSGMSFNDLSYQITDINGDGVLDVTKASSSERKTWLGTGTAPYTLTKVKNGLGGEIAITYKTLSSIDNTGEDDIPDLGFSGYVVSSTTYDDGMGNKATYAYDYEKGLFEPDSREFRGFGKVNVSRPDGSISEHYFHQRLEMKGLEYISQVFNQSTKLRMQVNSKYSPESKDGYYTVQLSSVEESVYDGYDTTPKTTKTSFNYDSYGNPATISHFGNVPQDDNKLEQFSYAYNETAWIMDKPKQVTLTGSDGTKKQETYYSYDNQPYGEEPLKGLVTKEEFWLAAGKNPAYSYAYDSYGNLLTEVDPNNHATSYLYDLSNVFVAATKNAIGQERRFNYDAGTGNIKSETDLNGYLTTYEYDIFGRLTKKIEPYDSSAYPSQELIYDFDGSAPEKVMIKNREQSLTQNTHDISLFYDGFSRLVQSRFEADNGQQVVEDTRYDGRGRMIYESNPYFATFSPNYAPPNNGVAGTSYDYDSLGRVTRVTNPDATSKRIAFNKDLTSVYDENGHRTDYLSDGFGRIVKVSEYNGNEIYNTTYSYDLADNLLNITDNENNTIKYEYDKLGRKTRLEDPNLGTWTYSYDPAGNLINQIEGNENEISIEYDALNRVAKKASSGETIRYTYDTAKNGTLSRVSLRIGTIDFSYDDRLRVVEKRETYDGIVFSTRYEYDSLDRVTKVTSPDGSVVAYIYDAQGLTAKIGNVLSKVEYNAVGLPVKKTYANNLISEYTYDPRSLRLTKIKTGNQQEFSYEYDAAGNVKKIEDSIESASYVMHYDDLDRLVKAEQKKAATETGWLFTYEYDSPGNMMKVVRDNLLSYAYEYGTRPIHAPLSINVLKINRAPEIVAVVPDEEAIFLDEGGMVKFSVEAEDANNDELSYSWELDGNEVSTTTSYTYMPTYDDAGEHALTITVSDDESDTSKELKIIVNGVNRAPTIVSVKPSSETVNVGEGRTRQFTVTATDPDDDELTYTWKLDDSTVSETATFVYAPSSADTGAHTLTITVEDEADAEASRTIKINVNPKDSCFCPDLNNDGIIDIFDLVRIGKNYGKDTDSCSECDLDGDGAISNADTACIGNQMNKLTSDVMACKKAS